jgi:membrane-bound lytic murein transglycosylase D
MIRFSLHRLKNSLISLFYPFLLLLTLTMLLVIFTFFRTDLNESIPFQSLFQKNYQIFALEMPPELSFAGERVPMEYFDVHESFDRELLINTYWQSQTLLFFKRANRFFPAIEPILKENNIPDDFKYLAIAESGLTNSISPAGAVGFWQFLSGTAKDYGLEINEEVDERYHLEKSTEAACRFLQESYETYGNWTMVAASYNAGRKGINTQVEIQKQDNYYDLLLSEETARYLFRILAIKTILENPETYGFMFRQQDLYQPVSFYTVDVDSTVTDFADFADLFGTNYKLLKFLNPWLRKPHLNNRSGRVYTLKIPSDNSRLLSPADSEDPVFSSN